MRPSIAEAVIMNKQEILDKFLGTPPDATGGRRLPRPLSHNESALDAILTQVKTTCSTNLEEMAKISVATTQNKKGLSEHLTKIMDTIQSQAFTHTNKYHRRQIIPKDSTQISIDHSIYEKTLGKKPDYLFADVAIPKTASTGTKRDAPQYPKGNPSYGPCDIAPRDLDLHSCPSFIEVKSSYKASPAYLKSEGTAETKQQSKARDGTGPGGADASIEDNLLQGLKQRMIFGRLRYLTHHLDNPSKKKGVPAVITGESLNTLTQGADYAQMILTARPFHLFVYGIFICGHRVCVGYFDTCGIVLSPDFPLTMVEDQGSLKDLEDADSGLRTFIRIIIRLTFEMEDVELGANPTVKIVSGDLNARPSAMAARKTGSKDNSAPLGDVTRKIPELIPDDFPRFQLEVPVEGDDQRTYTCTTVGKPVWRSYSVLHGRGSWVWHVIARHRHPEADAPSQPTASILKVAWRSSRRMNEYQIYRTLEKRSAQAQCPFPTGVAQVLAGGDMKSDNGEPQSVCQLRGATLQPAEYNRVVDRQLHCVLLSSFGRPIWKYETLEELVATIRDVAGALDQLHEQGFLHRDISPGNILIRASATYSPAMGRPGSAKYQEEGILVGHFPPKSDNVGGFLADFEYASFLPDRSEDEQVAKLQIEQKQPGDGITGTITCMALSLLSAIRDRKVISRTLAHDLESLCWVTLWALYEGTQRELKHVVKEYTKIMNKPECPSSTSTKLSRAKEQINDHLNELTNEFKVIFSYQDAGELYLHRLDVLTKSKDGSFEGIKALLEYANQARIDGDPAGTHLANLAEYLWMTIGKLSDQFHHPSLDPKKDMVKWLTELLEKIREAEVQP